MKFSGFTFVIHVTNKILMDTDISYTLYHTCKRPFIPRLQPWKEVDTIYIIARETLILTLSTLLIKTNVFKQQLHCPRYSTWARQSNTWMCFFNVFSGKHVRIERLWTYNFWNSLFYKKKVYSRSWHFEINTFYCHKSRLDYRFMVTNTVGLGRKNILHE